MANTPKVLPGAGRHHTGGKGKHTEDAAGRGIRYGATKKTGRQQRKLKSNEDATGVTGAGDKAGRGKKLSRRRVVSRRVAGRPAASSRRQDASARARKQAGSREAEGQP